ncbi:MULTISPECIES: alcohol dehydrogenase catalytic domain-containing protein [Streptomyces]|uniref:alcohol dehydrogenase catalytic domain-containing protein n=1 Tax=Streptomyces TaxID=1883 RepID=UPI00073DFCF6|nr:Alcohol dehydrogenase, propanol-preferring [Streptomyces reticuli]
MYGTTPRGHSGKNEVAGVIAEPGRGWQVGERGAVGRFGSTCGHCPACRRGNVVHCQERRAPGLSYPGGWSTTPTVPASVPTRVPRGLCRTEATSSGRAAAMGSSTGAIGRGADKRETARSRGAALPRRHGAATGTGAAGTGRSQADPVHGRVHRAVGGTGRRARAARAAHRPRLQRASTVTGLPAAAPPAPEAQNFAVATGVRPRVRGRSAGGGAAGARPAVRGTGPLPTRSSPPPHDRHAPGGYAPDAVPSATRAKTRGMVDVTGATGAPTSGVAVSTAASPPSPRPSAAGGVGPGCSCKREGGGAGQRAAVRAARDQRRAPRRPESRGGRGARRQVGRYGPTAGRRGRPSPPRPAWPGPRGPGPWRRCRPPR